MVALFTIYHWSQRLSKVYPIAKQLDAQQFRFDRLRPEIQEQVWNDACWTRAIFIRDPAERVLSANLDNVVQTHETQRKPPFGYNVSFAEAIHRYSLVGRNSTWSQ
jgi:hypothetical protein